MKLQAHDTRESILFFSLFSLLYTFTPLKHILVIFILISVLIVIAKEKERELRMEEDFQGRPTELQLQCFSARIMSPEIVEIGEESKTIISSRDGAATDVYVAVGKDDIDVLKWALNHVVSPDHNQRFADQSSTTFLVGRLARSQLTREQLRVYINEENNRRRNLLEKYIRLCTDAKVLLDQFLRLSCQNNIIRFNHSNITHHSKCKSRHIAFREQYNNQSNPSTNSSAQYHKFGYGDQNTSFH
ncbi:uncharacterized protein LOC103498862 isoform X3 [Cucumis melo]|uniref:Uncharacterized protein LOC103498862 isoform X3 n=1 Tax=Cucumis melo TaxID=3656 RepID=A0ABM3LDA1_CUCME|nr:uncharacterized protein LOC103498862 isoform X3 [Cucumis melo]XP_050948010.1 uncharacterized protein LOC103498862 isoform X3 [Cucumis melo]